MVRPKRIEDRARQAVAGAASVALATSGLSSCNDNGAVDPLPPPLQCNTVNTGQTLIASAALSAGIVTIVIENQSPEGLWSDSVAVNGLVNALAIEVSKPRAFSRDPLTIRLELDPPTTSTASFTVVGQLRGLDDKLCDFTRTYNLTIAGGGVTIALLRSEQLPLHARQRAEIVLTGREGRTVFLEARSTYRGATTAEWVVAHGQLEADGHRARWSLPPEPGIYQVELIVDYGEDGFALDALTLELG